MTIYYSATTNAFYDSQVYNVNNIPEDKVAVSASTYNNLMAQQCAGRVIVAAADGTPTTIAQTCGSCTSTKYATKTELTNGLAAKANDSNVVHKTGDETINGVKSFGSVIKATNGTVQVGADTGYSVTFNYNGNITSKQARGTYNIFFPEGSGTLALTSDINGKANDSDVVHKTGDETITGNKTFNNNVTVCGNFYDKNVQADLTQTPASNLYTQYRFVDKNNATMGYIQHVQRNTGVNQLTFIARDSNNTDYGFLVNTNKELLPVGGNTYSLGASGAKWANVYSTNDITNKVITYSVTNHNDTSSMTVSGGSSWDTGSTLFLYGNSHSNYPGAFNLTAKNTTNESKLIGFPNGTLTWGGKSLAIDENLVHRSGNETINGVKGFNNLMYIYNNMSNKNSQMDLFTTPANTLYAHYMFVDKNDEVAAYMQYGQQNSGTDFIGLFIHDKNRALHGIQVTTNKEVRPIANNTYNLGSSTNKWANVYATTFNGNLKGNADTATKATQDASGNVITTTYAINANPANRQLLCSFEGGLDSGDITLSAPYTNYKALLVVFSHDNGNKMASEKVDTYELALRQEIAKENAAHGDQSFCLIGNPECGWWSCSGSSTTTVLYHVDNKDIRIHKIYGLA